MAEEGSTGGARTEKTKIKGGKGRKTVQKRGKRVRTGRKHESVGPKKIYTFSSGRVERKKKPCPRCGPGTWLAGHGNREYCGRCGYTLFLKKGEPGKG